MFGIGIKQFISLLDSINVKLNIYSGIDYINAYLDINPESGFIKCAICIASLRILS